MAVLKEDDIVIVGHVPRNLSPSLFQFLLRRDVNKAFTEVTGQKVNRGAGYGLEIPCTYCLYGPPAYVNRMQEIVESLAAYSGTYIHVSTLLCAIWEAAGRV